MRIIECDRCHKRLEKPEKIGYVALNWRDPRTDELAGSSPTEELDFCDECMDAIANFLSGKPEPEPEPAPEPDKAVKVNVGKIRELAENGKSFSEIAKEVGCSYPTVKKYLGRS